MSNLYQLTNNYEILLTMLYDEETDEQMILDTLEGIEGEIEIKADGYAKIIKELLGDAEKIKAEKLRLEARQKIFENRANMLKDNLENSMKQIGKTKFKTELFSFNIQKNGGTLPLIIDIEAEKIPFEYYKHTENELDNKKIRQALDEGKINFAHYGNRGESLRIK